MKDIFGFCLEDIFCKDKSFSRVIFLASELLSQNTYVRIMKYYFFFYQLKRIFLFIVYFQSSFCELLIFKFGLVWRVILVNVRRLTFIFIFCFQLNLIIIDFVFFQFMTSGVMLEKSTRKNGSVKLLFFRNLEICFRINFSRDYFRGLLRGISGRNYLFIFVVYC